MQAPRDAHRQLGYHLRMDWGLTGAAAISSGCDIAVVVDVLSFTTALNACASGRELLEIGYPDDVLTAGELDQGRCVPSLEGGAFRPRG